jgi:urease accessory protein
LIGALRLRAGVRDGRTVLLESQGTYPLQVMRPQAAPRAGGLSLVLLLLSGGLLDGDDVSVDVVVEAGARLALRTQAATQVHAGCSGQTLRAVVGDGGWFSYVPRALVPHAGARYHGRAVVEMAAGARVLLGEPLAPGRVRFGEEFAYAQMRLDVDVLQAGHLIARERALIRPDATLRAAQFGAATHTAGIYQLGPDEPAIDVIPGPTSSVGTTPLARGGWYHRAMSTRAADLDQFVEELVTRWWCG